MISTENNILEEIIRQFSPKQLATLLVGYTMAILIVVCVLFLIVRHIRKKWKNLKRLKIGLGKNIFEAEFDGGSTTQFLTYRIAILDPPASVSGNPAKLNDLKVKVYDRENNPLRNKEVKITLAGHEDNVENYISGPLVAVSDEEGYAIFQGLQILRRGSFSIVFHADNVNAKAKPFDVTPPGIDVRFEKEKLGSDEYAATLKRAISLSKGGDRVLIDGEEIK